MVGSKVGTGGDVGRDGGGDESSMMISSLVRDVLWLRIVASTESRLLSERESGDGPKSVVRLRGGGPEEVERAEDDADERDWFVIADPSSDVLDMVTGLTFSISSEALVFE